MDPETQRLINLLKVSFRVLGVSNREVARRLEMSPSYVSKLLSGSSELRLDHLIRMCRAADLEPSEFFHLAYPKADRKGSAASAKLRELLQSLPAAAPPSPAQMSPDEEAARMEEMFKAMLARLLGQGGSGGG